MEIPFHEGDVLETGPPSEHYGTTCDTWLLFQAEHKLNM